MFYSSSCRYVDRIAGTLLSLSSMQLWSEAIVFLCDVGDYWSPMNILLSYLGFDFRRSIRCTILLFSCELISVTVVGFCFWTPCYKDIMKAKSDTLAELNFLIHLSTTSNNTPFLLGRRWIIYGNEIIECCWCIGQLQSRMVKWWTSQWRTTRRCLKSLFMSTARLGDVLVLLTTCQHRLEVYCCRIGLR